jgi:ABC-2 type transport system ATP-binding protein
VTRNRPGDQPIIRLRNVSKQFVKRRSWDQLLRHPMRREFISALSDVSIDINRGEFFGLLGQNGAGKTTLFKTLATLVLPDSGSASVGAFDVVSDPHRVRAMLTPVIAEERSLFWRLSAVENLRLFAALYGLKGTTGINRAQEVLDTVGLGDTGEKLVGAFSSGMKQRLLIGRALLARSEVLLLDEPTRSLDPLAARDFRHFLRTELVDKHGYTVLLATHNAEEALELCDRVSVLHKGRLLAVGTVDELVVTAGRDTYRFTAKKELEASLNGLLESGEIHALKSATGVDESWMEFELQMQGGLTEASNLLARLVATGIPVAEFERVDLALPDLLERILADAENA